MNTQKINLKKNAGISLSWDRNKLVSNDLQFSDIVSCCIEDMRCDLLNKQLYCPENFYHKYLEADYNDIFKKKKLRLNYYVVYGGVAGIEYLKTHAFILRDYPRIVEVLNGKGRVLIKTQEDQIYIVKVKTNDKILIPASAAVVFVNTKYSPMILEEVSYLEGYQIERVEENDSIPYYIISKNSKPALVQNPSFIQVDKIRFIKLNKLLENYDISIKTPIIKQIMRKYDEFSWLFEQNYQLEYDYKVLEE